MKRRAAVVGVAALCRVAAALDLPATYRLEGSAQVSAAPNLDRTVPLHADAVLRRGRPGELRVSLGAEGVSCEVLAHGDTSGALRFEGGQRCAIDLRSSEARGHLDVVLRSGTGQVDDDRLALDLALDVDGTVSLHSASRLDVLGQVVEVPSGWLPETPVHGRAHATADGRRDRSRASPAR